MKRLLAIYGFVFGCVVSLCSAVLYYLGVRGVLVLPDRPGLITAAIALNVGTWILALYHPIVDTPWRPVFRVTPILAVAAKAVLAGVLALVAGTFFSYVWLGRDGTQQNGQLFLSFLMSLALLQAVYLTFYWAVRPENIFPPTWIHRWRAANPLLVRVYRKFRASRTRTARRSASRLRRG